MRDAINNAVKKKKEKFEKLFSKFEAHKGISK